MSALASPQGLKNYRVSLSQFNEIEDFMGEIAELLTHMADTLTSNQETGEIGLREDDWPSFTRLQSLFEAWRERRLAVLAAWSALSAKERARAEPLPMPGKADLLQPVL